jgi:CubicO group peptidase (beta-lactamase class C family)
VNKGSSSTKSSAGQPVNEFCLSPTPDAEAKRVGDALALYYETYKGTIPGGTTVPDYPRGAAITMVKGGKLFLICTFGLADRDNKIPVTERTIIPVGSASKGFTGIATVKIYDRLKNEGLETPDKMLVKKYLPDYKLFYPKLTDQMTVADLLVHKTGLIPHNSMFYLTTLNRDEIFNRIRFLNTIKDFTYENDTFKPQDPPLGFHLKRDFHYNNINYMVVGKILAKISGRDRYEDVIKEEFFGPLGMSDSYFLADRTNPDVESRVARGYSWVFNNGELGSYQIDKTNAGLIEVGPAAAVMTTPYDISRWLLFNTSKGAIDGNRLMSEESFDLALQDYHRYRGGNKRVGFGWVAFDQKYPQIPGHGAVTHVYHWGIVEGYSMQVNYVPDTNPSDGVDDSIGVSVMTNEAADRDFVWNVMHNSYRALWLPGTPAPEKFYDDPEERPLLPDPIDPANPPEGPIDLANEHQFLNMAGLCQFGLIKGPNYSEGRGLAGDFYHPAYGKMSVIKEGSGYIVKFHKQQWALNEWAWPTAKPYKPDQGAAYFSPPVALESLAAPAPMCFSHDGSQGIPNKIKIVFEIPYLPVEFLRKEVFDLTWGNFADLFADIPGDDPALRLNGGKSTSIPYPEGSRQGVVTTGIPDGNSQPSYVVPPSKLKQIDPKVLASFPQIGGKSGFSRATSKCSKPVGCQQASQQGF